MNSFLLVYDLFSFVFWENPRPEKNVSRFTDLYRFSRIAELDVAYNATQMNCDVCSTYLTTGWTNWSTMKKFHRPFTHVSIPVNEGQITRLTLEQLTAENSML